MEKEILRVLNKMEEMQYITINEHLNREALARMFLEIFKDMTLRRTLEIFVPKELF